MSKVNQKGGPRSHSSSPYNREFIFQVVGAIENGLRIKDAMTQYGVSQATLWDWMEKYGSEAYLSCKKQHVTGQKKREIVRLVLAGKLTIHEARIASRVSSTRTVRHWIKQYAEESKELTLTNSSVMPLTQQTQEVEALLKQLAEAQLKIAALETMIDIAEQQLNISIRKKPGAKQSSK